MPKESITQQKGSSVIQHVYAHYVFEMEVHPDEDPEKLNADVRSLHFERAGE